MKTLREVDALVAEKVMGSTLTETDEFNELAYSLAHASGRIRRMSKEQQKQEFWRTVKRANGDYIPAYSADIAAAWQLVEYIHQATGRRLDLRAGYREKGGWIASFDASGDVMPMCKAATMPLAVCLAALAAVGHPVEEEIDQ